MCKTVYELQGVPKFVKQKSAFITSELEVRIWSGTFQMSRQVLKFSFKPPNGIPLVQSCLEIQPVIVESYSCAGRIKCCLWFHESQTPTSVQDQVSQKITPKNDHFRVVKSVRWNWPCISQATKSGSTLYCRWDDRKCAADLRSQSTKIN